MKMIHKRDALPLIAALLDELRAESDGFSDRVFARLPCQPPDTGEAELRTAIDAESKRLAEHSREALARCLAALRARAVEVADPPIH